MKPRAALIVSLIAAVAAVLPGAAAEPQSVVPYEPLDQMFHAYGDAGASWSPGQRRTWTGADSTFSVPLPDGRTVWIFSDSFLSPIDGCGVGQSGVCHRRRAFQGFVNNTFVLQQGEALTETLYGGTHDAPRALIEPISARPLYSFYWMGDGTVEDNELRVFVHRYPKLPTIPPASEGNDVAVFSLPGMTLDRIEEGLGFDGRARPWAYLPGGETPVPIVWGAAVLEQDDYTYVYGTEEYPLAKHLHVARVPAGRLLTDAWEYFDGAGWSVDRLRSARVLSNVAGELSIVQAAEGFRLVASELGIGDVFMATAPKPEGPWGARQRLFTPPEVARGATVYNAKEHPQYASPGKIVISYNVNGQLDGNDIYADVHVYRPRFVEVTL